MALPVKEESVPKKEPVVNEHRDLIIPKENTRSKSTINLKAAFNGVPKQEEKKAEEVVEEILPDQAIDPEKLKQAWNDFSEMRKHQIAEYTLLRKEFSIAGVVVTIVLANPFEEPLFQNLRVQLIAHLRGRLNNNSISIVSVMQESEGKKIAYTDKEKFNLLAEKNPALRELKERFGLDSDY